ncbi:hypothetical protein CBS101457_005342 [Exobasidium rhododendri]|nr:hypothetical protein CBS101457_005342 [Exobasidium rhododendri]
MHITSQSVALTLLAILAVTFSSAQQENDVLHARQQQTTASSTSASGSSTSSSRTSSASSSTITQSANVTASTTATSVSTSTPSTFPTASQISTGLLAGTAQAPFPGGTSGSGSGALGPDDSYIAAAMTLAASSSGVICLAVTMLFCVVGGLVIL